MDLLTTLVLGSYVYTTAIGKWLEAKLEKAVAKLIDNHFAHVNARLDALEKRAPHESDTAA